MMARAATAPELASMRSDGQVSQLYLVVHNPTILYRTRLASTPASLDQVVELAYTFVSGNLADVIPGMTLWVGSQVDRYDKGQVRIRKTPTGSKFYVSECSEINFASGDYLTVVDEFNLWARHWDTTINTVVIDYDIAYTDQHKYPAPVPVLGPDAVLWLDGATVALSPDASGSWVVGGTITGYSWAAPGASATANLTTATPTITYNATGTYRIACTVTASNGKTSTGYRYVHVVTPAVGVITDFQLQSLGGSRDSGGWKFSARVLAGATFADIRDRAKVLLVARDYYGGTKVSIGPLAGYETIVASGWIDGESIEQNPSYGAVTFTVEGPQFWLGQIPGFPSGIKSVADDPRDDLTTSPVRKGWLEFKNMTVDAALWTLIHWRSTVDLGNDFSTTGTGTAYYLHAADAPVGTLWSQITAVAELTILAKPLCDRYGRLYIQVDSQYLPVANRSTIPTVMEITTVDWRDTITYERRVVPQVGMLDISGVSFDGTTEAPIFSRAVGHVFKRIGRIETRDRLLFTSQAQANALAGAILAQLNAEFPNVTVKLAQNNRLIDIAPLQFVTLTLQLADTPRGMSFTLKRFIPRAITYSYDATKGYLWPELSLEGEVAPETAVTYTPPVSPVTNAPTTPPTKTKPPHPFTPPPTIIPNPPLIPPPTDYSDCKNNVIHAPPNGPWATFFTGILRSDDTNPYRVAYLPCVIRAANYDTLSKFYVYATWEISLDGGTTWVPWLDTAGLKLSAINPMLDDVDLTSLEAVTDLGTGSRGGQQSPAVSTAIWGFKVEITNSEGGYTGLVLAQTYCGASDYDKNYFGVVAPVGGWIDNITWERTVWPDGTPYGHGTYAIWHITGLPASTAVYGTSGGTFEFTVKCISAVTADNVRCSLSFTTGSPMWAHNPTAWAPSLTSTKTGPTFVTGDVKILQGDFISPGEAILSATECYLGISIDHTTTGGAEFVLQKIEWVKNGTNKRVLLFGKAIKRISFLRGSAAYNICNL